MNNALGTESCDCCATPARGPEERTSAGELPLHLAAEQGHAETVQALCAASPLAIDSPDVRGRRGRSLAAQREKQSAEDMGAFLGGCTPP